VNDESCDLPQFGNLKKGQVVAPPQGWESCDDFIPIVLKEKQIHENGATRPYCTSDHLDGIAIDIGYPAGVQKGNALYKEWINVAASLPGDLKLCHYIGNDGPHFGLYKYLTPEKRQNCISY
jgi:hypothetical protein